MGILEDFSQMVERGTSSAKSMGKTAQLKLQISDLERKRVAALSGLGCKLYPVIKENEDIAKKCQDELSAVVAIDEQINSVQIQIEALESAEKAEREAFSVARPRCPQCGKRISPDDAFCTNCGAKLELPEAISGGETQTED